MTLQQNEFDQNTGFCLFRIPAKGARVIWEITNSCNYGCRYCIFSSTSRKPKEELDTKQAMQTINALRENGFTHLKITGGEPFMRPDLMEILEYAVSKGLKTDISTNASMITDELAERLARLKLEMVHISLDGHTLDIQEKVRGKKTFEPTIKGIKLLVSGNVFVRIGCVIYKGNEDKLKEITEYCHELGVGEVIFSLMEPVGRMRGKTDFVSTRSVEEMKQEIEVIKSDFANKIKVSFNFAEKQKSSNCAKCPGGEKFLFISHKGVISPCTWVSERRPDYISKSSLHTHSLAELLEAEENVSFRKVATELSESGLNQCPMQVVSSFKEAENINQLFKSGGLSKDAAKYDFLSAIYPFTSENIAGYFPLLGLEGKSILTIGGSGDHLINAYLLGAKQVDCFDINLLAKYYSELKITALKNLSFEEFSQFFFTATNHCFEYSVYQSLSPLLSLETRYFFDKAYKRCSQNGAALRNSNLFRDAFYSDKQAVAYNLYLQSKDSYMEAAKLLHKKSYNWQASSLQELNLSSSYDYILLSNIPDYAHKMFDGDYMQSFIETQILPVQLKLNQNGCIVFYVYDGQDLNQSSKRSKINIEAERKNYFRSIEGTHYKELQIPSAFAPDNHDIIGVITKL